METRRTDKQTDIHVGSMTGKNRSEKVSDLSSGMNDLEILFCLHPTKQNCWVRLRAGGGGMGCIGGYSGDGIGGGSDDFMVGCAAGGIIVFVVVVVWVMVVFWWVGGGG